MSAVKEEMIELTRDDQVGERRSKGRRRAELSQCHPEIGPATKLAILRALGQDARLNLERIDGAIYYQAIDLKTGRVRREWTEEEYLRLIKGVRDDVFDDIDAGLFVQDRL